MDDFCFLIAESPAEVAEIDAVSLLTDDLVYVTNLWCWWSVAHKYAKSTAIVWTRIIGEHRITILE
ncbi:hypothetical protein GCM10025777_37230 [Membranihabitans marinus]|uniref:Uncharacterized protein n=1 Tax=Nesterenkonia rhizosphaerae TaxID=1348272 RepID=A0ABP9G1L9_9MICC